MAHDIEALSKAEARYVRVSAQKARLVVDMIRGQQAGDAINILSATNKRIAEDIEKVLRSAIANAEAKAENVDVDRLFVAEALCERRAAAEADPSGSDGSGLPVPTPDIAHCSEAGRASAGSSRGVRSMGQKVHPYGFRLGVTKTWRSRWFAKQDYSKLLHEDLELRESLHESLEGGGHQFD